MWLVNSKKDYIYIMNKYIYIYIYINSLRVELYACSYDRRSYDKMLTMLSKSFKGQDVACSFTR